MPTVGSQEGLSETVDERTLVPSGAPVPPPLLTPGAPQAVAKADLTIEPIARRMAPDEPSHVLRNLFLSAAAVALVVVGAFLMIQQFSAVPQPIAARRKHRRKPRRRLRRKRRSRVRPHDACPRRRRPSPKLQKPAPEEKPEPPKETARPIANEAGTHQSRNRRRNASPGKPAPDHVAVSTANQPGSASHRRDLSTHYDPGGARSRLRLRLEVHHALHRDASRRPPHLRGPQQPDIGDARKIIEIPRDTGLIVDLISEPPECSA